jgi:uncharacterized protein YyaL (SSP411 family)
MANSPPASTPAPAPNLADAFVAAQLAAGKSTNRLIHEKSPYLLQHAFNPVDWYPWGDAAFTAARAQDRPIFVSIGYSTCHWCHVMERESFENEVIAASMNEHFINVKIDREERPDVDRIYMTVVQAMTGSGGWPMSVFLTPSLQPFYAGTYFPPRGAYGRPGFTDVLQQIAAQWQRDRDKIEKSAGRVVTAIGNSIATRSKGSGAGAEQNDGLTLASDAPPHPALAAVVAELVPSFDAAYGGFGGAPKFPRPGVFPALFLHHLRTGTGTGTGAGRELELAVATLQAMAAGGIYDQLGGGFHRYSVDAQWRVPHFEKMLYDQAQLIGAYTAAFQLTGDRDLGAVAVDTVEYVLRGLQASAGGFYSAEDADSAIEAVPPGEVAEKVEGGFYMWTVAQLDDALGQPAAAEVASAYGATAAGNTLADPHGELGNRNVLYRAVRASHPAVPMPEVWRQPLWQAQSQRPRPLLDDKVIAAWNGMMIGALADAAGTFQRDDFRAAAVAAAGFLGRELVGAGGELLRRYRDGEARFSAGLSDYGAVIDGLGRLYQEAGDLAALQLAVQLVPAMLERFVDADGRMFDTPEDATDLLLRSRELYDSAEPAGTTIAAQGLLLVARTLGQEHWYSAARRAVALALAEVGDHLSAVPQLASVADLAARPAAELVLTGAWEATEAFRIEVARRYLPQLAIVHVVDEAAAVWLGAWLPAIADMLRRATNADGTVQPLAYLCESFVCHAPVSDAPALAAELDAFAGRGVG